MAHLKTKATTSNLTEREKWKWNLVKPLYQKGLSKFDIINLVSFIDKMMTLPPPLELKFNDKLNEYEKELKMPFVIPIEELAMERGAKKTYQQNIIDLLTSRFGILPESLIKSLQQIDDLTRLKQLHLDTIRVNSVSEFEQLINHNFQN
jgi:hypothetical protein